MKKHQIDLEAGKYYHIYNRGNNSEKMFFNDRNYEFFLRRYDEYLSNFVETYAYCLLPNHFHLLIRVKETEAKALHDANAKALHLEDAMLFAGASHTFHRLFTSYSKAINKQQNRHGSLIENPFKRIDVTSETYLTNLVLYIHTNPQLHGFVKDFRTYQWSSYQKILSNHSSKLKKETVLEWFGDKENYSFCHQNKIEFENIKRYLLD